MNDSHEKTQEFWHWFQINRAKFDLLVDTAEPFWDVALDQLKQLNRHLCFELSAPGAGVRELIDTALGERAAASEIQYLEVFALPDAPESHGYLPLCELPAYIEWRKQQRKLAG